ncbi:uncharacterized protein LOC129774568 [Toxorhynchites rutilus septentrionalis]|uniref:uncharacterized protein LOC129774568 n=1 Tax=Toxorhynchites rutilus septentrionalis TaxID=329112 RepID=UPI00247923A3|nr:uncharacterized protein LOC129774568 [Toxorhynchites rutilus septentrionalis]
MNAAIVAKINYPPFDAEDVDTWFICMEAAFSVNQIKQGKHKFNALIVALGSRAKFVYSTIAKCNLSRDENRYQTLKDAIVAHFRPSEMQRLTSLPSGMTLGDQKPSVLLSEMRRLGGTGCTDSVLSNLWLRALPTTARSIITAMPSSSLDEQAKVADQILEAPSNTVATIRTNQESTIAKLESRIDALTRRLEDAFSGEFRRRERSRTRFGNRSAERRSSTPSQSKGIRRWICWFHYRHGAKATKCEKHKGDNPNVPCIFYDGNVETYTRHEPAKITSTVLNRTRIWRIHVRDQNTHQNFLIDTGADMSVIPPTPREQLNPVKMNQLFAANGSPINTYGTKRLNIDIGLRRPFVWVFTIADVKSPIIGSDFLRQHDLLVDLRRNKLIDNRTNLEVNNINAVSEPMITTFRRTIPCYPQEEESIHHRYQR